MRHTYERPEGSRTHKESGMRKPSYHAAPRVGHARVFCFHEQKSRDIEHLIIELENHSMRCWWLLVHALVSSRFFGVSITPRVADTWAVHDAYRDSGCSHRGLIVNVLMPELTNTRSVYIPASSMNLYCEGNHMRRGQAPACSALDMLPDLLTWYRLRPCWA